MMRKHFGDASEGRDNNFDFLRFFLASLVIFSHSFATLYNGQWIAYDPLLHLTKGQFAFGGGAVDGFFLISGFLITKSWIYSKGVDDYARKRALRILPALAVVLLVTVLIVGPLATDLNLVSYFHSPLTWAYFRMMGTKNLHLTDTLPGVFTHNPIARRVNGSLWTIRCEVLCYIMVAILGFLQAYRRPAFILLAAVAALPLMARQAQQPGGLGDWTSSFHVLTFFLWGMVFYLYRESIPYSRTLLGVALLLLIATDLLHVLPWALPFAFGYVLFYTAFSQRLKLQRFAKYGDFSYGIYLYAFPIQQMLVAYFARSLNAYTLAAAAFVLSLGMAILSWNLVEKRFLKRRRTSAADLSAMAFAPATLPALPKEAELAGKTP